MQIFIMAQGNGDRWSRSDRNDWIPPVEYKQLLPVGDETIIGRTYRMASEYSDNVISICEGEFLKEFPKGTTIASLREPTGTLLHGIWETRPMWYVEDRNIFLLGDVVYSEDTLNRILSDTDLFTIYGRLGENKYTGKEAGELFSLSFFGNQWKHRMLLDLRNISGKLWNLYEVMGDEFFRPVDDYTDDINSPEGYQKWYKTLKHCAESDR
jgi:hypothetical protein